ncbi:hypothetical protein NKH18_42325 [Streptomyces sp. M10(2022)]
MWSLLSYTQRLMAGALGQPFATTGSMLAETDLRHGKEGSSTRCRIRRIRSAASRCSVRCAPLHSLPRRLRRPSRQRRGLPPLGEGTWAAYAATEGSWPPWRR